MTARKTSRAFTIIELLMVVTILGLLISILLPSIAAAKEQAKQTVCGAHLKDIFLAMVNYANNNDQKLPSLSHSSNPWNKVGGSATVQNDEVGTQNTSNTRALFTHLIRGGLTTAQVFICPSTMHKEVPDDQVKTLYDFPSHKNISYSYQNQWAFTTNMKDNPGLAIMADRNPLLTFADSGEATANSKPRYPVKAGVNESANSENHRIGQNVLFLGGHVRFVGKPTVGMTVNGKPDNIYTRSDGSEWGQPSSASGYTGGPDTGRKDSWLVD